MNDSTECYIRSSLQNTIKHLVPPSIVRQYVQINRAEYINMKFVEELLGNTLKTSNKKTFAVSDNYLPDLKTAMNIMH